MKHKTTTLMSYLILGISLLSIFITAQSCTDEGNYQLYGDYIYINDTDSVIEVKGPYGFVINPQEEHTIKISPEGPEHPTVHDDNYDPVFKNLTVVVFNNNLCDTLHEGKEGGTDEGILGIDNYTSEKVSDRYFKFTYHFTDEDFVDAVPCN